MSEITELSSSSHLPEEMRGHGGAPERSLKLRHVIGVLASYAILFGGFGYSMFHDARLQLVSVAQSRIEAFQVVLDRQISASEEGMQMALELLAGNDDIMSVFAERRRDDLQDLLLPLYQESLEPNYRVTQFHFHTAPATSFLRLHRTEKFGDDISEWRRTIVKANDELKPVVGIEVSRSGPGLKVVHPVWVEGLHVGSVEMAARYPTLIEEIAADFGLEFAVGIERIIFEEARCADLLEIEVVNGDQIFSSFSAPLIRRLLDDEELPESPKVLTTLEQTVVLTSVPIRDFNAREVGRIALALDATEEVAQLRRNLAIKLGLLLIAALVISGATLGLLDRRHKREQLELTRQWATRVEEKNAALIESQRQLEARNLFIRSTFGRYLSDEIVESLLEHPEGLKLGGEQRTVTIMMTDLRGFTAMSERLDPEDVVWILNQYLGSMTEIIKKHQGTIDEFIGDAILVIFGAPLLRDDDASRAVRCGIEMQLEMEKINRKIQERGLPDIEMGIGINTGMVVVGNIGSESRAKYGVVGPPVNLTARIESYTTGSQIMISETTKECVGEDLRVADVLEVKPKGVSETISIFEVAGLGGESPMSMPRPRIELENLSSPIDVRFVVLEGKHEVATMDDGQFVRLSKKYAELRSANLPKPLSNLKLDVGAGSTMVFAKVKRLRDSDAEGAILRFTSLPPEAWEILETSLEGDAEPASPRPEIELETLEKPVEILFRDESVSSLGEAMSKGRLVRLSNDHAELETERQLAPETRLRIDLPEEAIELSAVVMKLRRDHEKGVILHFTSMSEEAWAVLEKCIDR